jgi:hypothetical protein
MNDDEIYVRIRGLIEGMPDLANFRSTGEVHEWIGRAAALIEATGDVADAVAFNMASQSLVGILRSENALRMTTILYKALAKAELKASPAMRGTFIAAGNPFDAIAAIGRVLSSASTDVLLVDPYADANALTEFAVLARSGTSIRILADAAHEQPGLKPASRRWVTQYGSDRPLEVRMAPKRSLHDRLIVIDRKEVWALGQSLNALAKRAHTSLLKVDFETAALKMSAYETIWTVAVP